MARHNLKVGDKGVIPVTITRTDEQWVTFTIPGYAHPLNMYEPVIEITVPVTPTRRKKDAVF